MTRKGLLSLIILLVSVPFSIHGQVVTLGIKGGTGTSFYSYYESGKYQKTPDLYPLTSFNGGLFLNLKISDHWCYHSEIIFEDKGNRSKYFYDSIPVRKLYNVTEKDWRHNYYIQFPQTIRYIIGISKKRGISIYFEAGGYFAYYISSKDVTFLLYDDTLEKSVHTYNNVDNNDKGIDTWRFDWGATIGTGILFPIWRGLLDVNFKYDHMIQPFIRIPELSIKAYYSVIGITIGYSLPVMKKYYD